MFNYLFNTVLNIQHKYIDYRNNSRACKQERIMFNALGLYHMNLGYNKSSGMNNQKILFDYTYDYRMKQRNLSIDMNKIDMMKY